MILRMDLVFSVDSLPWEGCSTPTYNMSGLVTLVDESGDLYELYSEPRR